MANAVDKFEVPEGDDLEISEAEIKTIECELNELLTPTNGDDKEECCLSLSPQVLEEQPDVTQIIQSVAKITWTEAKGKFFGSGFLAKITLGVEDRLGFFTAGHNLYDKGTKQLVNFSSVQLRFKGIQKQTKKIALSKFLGQKHVLIVAYKTCKIISRNGQESTQPCQKGLDFGAVIFTAPVDSAARFLSRLGLSYLQVASPGACSSAPNMPVQLVGFPQYIENSPMRILPGNELEVPQGNIPDHCYDMETETGASGGSVLDKGGRVVAVHIRGQNIKKGDQGNWGLGFDIIREELQLCLNIPSLPSQAQPGTSDPHNTQGMPSVVKFMKNLKLDEYISAFEEHHIDMEVLEDCEPEELEQMLDKMEVSLGHSKKIKKALKHEKQEKKEQMKKEQEREEDQLENIGTRMDSLSLSPTDHVNHHSKMSSYGSTGAASVAPQDPYSAAYTTGLKHLTTSAKHKIATQEMAASFPRVSCHISPAQSQDPHGAAYTTGLQQRTIQPTTSARPKPWQKNFTQEMAASFPTVPRHISPAQSLGAVGAAPKNPHSEAYTTALQQFAFQPTTSAKHKPWHKNPTQEMAASFPTVPRHISPTQSLGAVGAAPNNPHSEAYPTGFPLTAATTPLEKRVASQLHLGSSSSRIIQGTEPCEEKLKIVNTITYNQNERIGDGGSSKVYKGMYNGKKVAVKKVDKDVLKHVEENREATILDIAGHENIVKCLATEQDDSFYYLALSLCKTDLSNAVRDPSVIKLDVITLLKEVTKGMEFIHSKTLDKPSIVHRDIKPSNVLLYEDEETGVQKIMLGDFGLSKKANPGVSYVSIRSGCGTKGWKSIEMMELEDENVTDRNVSVLSDIFPLGCLFYFVLTNGKHPFQNENETERHREINIWDGKYNLDALDEMKFPHARSLIEKMISSNPKDRPRATQILENTMFKSMIRKGKITYNANERLGDGATSKVFKGAYEGRVVAVKKIDKDCFRATDYDKEASILNMTQHENVMKCFGREEDDSFCYLALSLCISDFANIIKDPAVCKLDVITLLEEATKGIEFIHSKSETKSAVAHRDIKPNNILIYEDELTGAQKVLIGDFGLSKKATSSLNVSIRSGCGTQGWKAKELMEREDPHILDRKISIISDIFSLGCVFYYILANGRHPFQKNTQKDLHRELNILNGEYNLDALDEAKIPHCRELIERMISSNPKDRPTASEVLENPMFNKIGSQERSLLSLSKFLKLFQKRHVAPAPVCNSVDAFGNPAHSCRFIQSFHSNIGATFFRSITTIIGRDWVKKIRNRFEDGTISPQDTVVILSGTHGPRTALTDSTKAVFSFVEEDKSFISKMKSTHPKIELVDVAAYHLRPEYLKKKVLELKPKFIIFAFCDSDGSKQCTCDVKQLFCRNEEERNILDE